ncbi:hypothetical protein ASC77_09645 [Nocardioides sp. Root1257]|nr:hypothetical protein ASC77_09645 [Nocardioides sp. Root1257]KRC48142.1 hypothetical protein ASE24_09650 [Nocardioides sp. Root224]
MTDGPRPVSKRRRWRWLLGTGVALMAAGALLLGYIAWQYVGTNWVSHRHQAEVVDRLERGWESGQERVRTSYGDAEAVVRIPRFGADYEMPVLEGTSDTALAAGFGHFDGSAGPGQVGNYALAAHRVTHGEPLRDMPDLEVGDQVVVETAGATYTYELVTAGDALTVPFDTTWVVDPLPTNPDPQGPMPPQDPGERLLTMTTCSELFHTDDRLVAFAVLTKTVRR